MAARYKIVISLAGGTAMVTLIYVNPTIGSIALGILGVVAGTLSGSPYPFRRAHWESFFERCQKAFTSRNQWPTPFIPPPLSSAKPSSLPLTPGKVPGNFSFPPYHQTNFSTSSTRFRNSILRKLEETAKIFHQIRPSPEHPFSTWSTMNADHIVLQIGPQTTLFINPEVLANFFQKASTAQRQAVQAELINLATRRAAFNRDEKRLSKEVGWIDQVDRKAHELASLAQSALAHALWERASYQRRVAAVLADAALKASKPVTPDSDLQKIRSWTEKAQRSTAAGHKRIDKVFGTDLASRYSPTKQKSHTVQSETPGTGGASAT